MEQQAPPRIFSTARRIAARRRLAAMQVRDGAARTMARELAADAIDRLEFLRDEFPNALVIGDWTGAFSDALERRGSTVTRADAANILGCEEIDEVAPLGGPYALIASLGMLDTVNDLPGALVLMRRALAPGGLAIASFAAAGTLPVLRAAMLAADGERPAPRIHPQVDVRSAGQLINRIGLASPVVDGWGFDVAYDSFDQLIGDLRAQGMSNVLADPGPPLTRDQYRVARETFEDRAGPDGKIVERFEFVTFSGWSPL